MNGLDILDYNGEGFQTMVCFETWRVAFTRYGKQQDLKNVHSLSRHTETDELFVLLDGSCTLYTAGNDILPCEEIQVTVMKSQKLYNIKTGTWHARSLTPNSCILIVENSNTGSHNTESLPLTENQYIQIH